MASLPAKALFISPQICFPVVFLTSAFGIRMQLDVCQLVFFPSCKAFPLWFVPAVELGSVPGLGLARHSLINDTCPRTHHSWVGSLNTCSLCPFPSFCRGMVLQWSWPLASSLAHLHCLPSCSSGDTGTQQCFTSACISWSMRELNCRALFKFFIRLNSPSDSVRCCLQTCNWPKLLADRSTCILSTVGLGEARCCSRTSLSELQALGCLMP